VAWLLLLLAGLFEVGFTTSLKLSQNFTVQGPTIAFIVCVVLSFELLARAVKTIPLGTAYAVWTSIGAVGTVLVGIFVFGEPTSIAHMGLLLLLIGAVIGLKLVESDTRKELPDAEATPAEQKQVVR
jgi:quaternary ammonium compound-resistance protein SugE